jgi:uncharacterized membrane protein
VERTLQLKRCSEPVARRVSGFETILGRGETVAEFRDSYESAQLGGTASDEAGAALPTPINDNIEQLIERQKADQVRRGWQTRLADAITAFSGSMMFVWLHVLWFGAWIAVNLGYVPGIEPFDEFPFGLLTMVVSLEAIFLSTFVLVSQNRMQLAADRRAELDLHVNLLAEREATEILRKLIRIEERLDIPVHPDEHEVVRELTQETNPVEIVDGLERAQAKAQEEAEAAAAESVPGDDDPSKRPAA